MLLVVLVLLLLPVEVGCGGGGHDRRLVVLQEEVGRARSAQGFFLDEVAGGQWQWYRRRGGTRGR